MIEEDMELLTLISVGAGIIVALFAVSRNGLELRALPRVNQRAEYNFVHEFATRTRDVNAISYAEELGYKILVTDKRLNTQQRKAILGLPNRVELIPLYSKVCRLLTVQSTGPILNWKHARHGNLIYRKFLISFYLLVYGVFGWVGLFSLMGPYSGEKYEFLDSIISIPTPISIVMILISAFFMFHALALKNAAKLIKMAGVTDGPINGTA